MGIKDLWSWLQEKPKLRFHLKCGKYKGSRLVFNTDREQINLKSHPIFAHGFDQWLYQGKVVIIDVGSLNHSIYKKLSVHFDSVKLASIFTSIMRCFLNSKLDVVLMADRLPAWLNNGKEEEQLGRFIKRRTRQFHGCKKKKLKPKTDDFYSGYPIYGILKHCVNELSRVFDGVNKPNTIKFIDCTQEADTAIIEYARQSTHPLFGVFTIDSDFYFWDLPCPVFDLHSLRCDLTSKHKYWNCNFYMGHSIWQVKPSRLMSFGLRLCFIHFKGNDCCKGSIKDVESARKAALDAFDELVLLSDDDRKVMELSQSYGTFESFVQRLSHEWTEDRIPAELHDFLGVKLMRFYLPKTLKPVKEDSIEMFSHPNGITMLPTVIEDLSNPIEESVNGLLTGMRYALYLRPEVTSMIDSNYDGEIQEWSIVRVVSKDSDAESMSKFECQKTKLNINDLSQESDIKPLAKPSRYYDLIEEKDTEVLIKMMSDFCMTEEMGILDTSEQSKMDVSKMWIFDGSDRENKLIDSMESLLETTISEMVRLIPGLQTKFELQMKAIRIQFYWRNRINQDSSLREIVSDLMNWVQSNNILPRPIDLHFQSLFICALRLVCFGMPEPPLHILFNGIHYHSVVNLSLMVAQKV